MLKDLFYHLSSLKARGIPQTRTEGTDGQDEGGGHGSDKDEVGVGESQTDVEGARKGPSDLVGVVITLLPILFFGDSI